MGRWAVILLLVGHLAVAAAIAGATVLPPSRHHRFLTYGLFNEEETALFFRDSGNAWGSVGASMAFIEMTEWAGRPQLVLHGTVSASFRGLGRFFDYTTETFDGRFGVDVELELAPELRLLLGFTHISGHVADGIVDYTLVPPNLGDDAFVARLVWDPGGRFRLGASLRPLVGSDPIAQAFNADQFAEWFPFGSGESATGGVPYLAAGLQEGGPAAIRLSWHAQLGVYFGSHVGELKRPTVRFAAGYYDGIDPRLKLARFRGARLRFPYAGVALQF